MSDAAKTALEALRDDFHRHVRVLSSADYLTVMEEFQTDLDGRIEAVKEENPELEDA